MTSSIFSKPFGARCSAISITIAGPNSRFFNVTAVMIGRRCASYRCKARADVRVVASAKASTRAFASGNTSNPPFELWANVSIARSVSAASWTGLSVGSIANEGPAAAIDRNVRDTSELEAVIAAQARKPNGGLIVMPDTFTDAHRVEITSLAARYRLPAVYPYRQFTAVGGLLSYGDDLIDNFRRAPTYVDRILKGAKPSELPVQAPVKFELVINQFAAF
jgi:hypothetical protein